ncbi:MAG: hypothetical protein MZV49_09895, partial [Rhodopseudomonas palustris]|nr:hypothetical protein [Rhodopseudomonas palustris]
LRIVKVITKDTDNFFSTCCLLSYLQFHHQGAESDNAHYTQHHCDYQLDAQLDWQTLLTEFMHASTVLKGRTRECQRADNHEKVGDGIDANRSVCPSILSPEYLVWSARVFRS